MMKGKKKGILFLCLFFILAWSLQAATSNPTRTSIEQNNGASSGIVVAYSDAQGEVLLDVGTGFYVGNGMVLTCLDVICDAKKVDYFTGAGDPIEIIGCAKIEDEHHLCLLRCKSVPKLKAATIGSYKLAKLNDTVYLMGYNEDLELFIDDCKISGLQKGSEFNYIATNHAFGMAATGGALFDGNGKVIGVSWGCTQSMNLSIAVDYIKASIDYLKKQDFGKIPCLAYPTSEGERIRGRLLYSLLQY